SATAAVQHRKAGSRRGSTRYDDPARPALAGCARRKKAMPQAPSSRNEELPPPTGHSRTMKPLTEQHLATFRRHMVEIIDMHFDLASDEIAKDSLDPDLRRALMDVPRHLFVPTQLAVAAYHDGPVPIGFDKTLSQPFIGALMLDLLDLRAGQRVLEVGTGLGYQAAVMAEMGAEVF